MARNRKYEYTTVWTIKAAAQSRGINSAYALSQKCQLLTYDKARKLWNGDGALTPDEIEALRQLFKCGINSLIKRTRVLIKNKTKSAASVRS